MNIPIENESELIAGLALYYETADLMYNEISKGRSLACQSGCSYCCHLHVTVKPYELSPLVHYVSSLPRADREIFDSTVAQNRILLEETADDSLLAVNFSCPFLSDGSCQVYDSRPLSCRVAHSKSQVVCEQAFDNPTSGVDADIIPELHESIRALEDEFEEIVGEYYDVSDYNMNEALFEALLDPLWIDRFLDGDEVFSDRALSRI